MHFYDASDVTSKVGDHVKIDEASPFLYVHHGVQRLK